MKRYFSVLAILCPFLLGAQEVVKPLTVGDAVPDVILQNMINHTATSARLSGFRGKGVVVDFFATWCTSCVRELPRLDSLQRRFAGRVQILLVAYEPAEKIRAFLQRRGLTHKVALPIVTADTLLKKYFPHQLLPHQVWIDEQGVVRAITEPEYLTAANLELLTNGRPLQLPLKQDIADYDLKKPLLEDGNGGGTGALLTKTTLTRYLPGIGSSEGKWTESGRTRYYWINMPLLELYRAALGFGGNRVVLEGLEAEAFVPQEDTIARWRAAHLYSYEVLVPKDSPAQQVREGLRENLDRQFSLQGRMERRPMKCWAVVLLPSARTALRSRGGPPAVRWDRDRQVKVLQHQTMGKVVEGLNSVNRTAPGQLIFVDETGYTAPVDIMLPFGVQTDLDRLRAVLKPYGLALQAVEREMEVFVLKEAANRDINKPGGKRIGGTGASGQHDE